MILNRLKLVASPPRHSRIRLTIELMFWTLDVNGAEMDASASARDNPASACLRAPQSLAPSPHIAVTLPMLWKMEMALVLSLGFDLANTLM